jgi:hypothetical protein
LLDAAEVIQKLERVRCRDAAEAQPDDLAIHQSAIGEVQVRDRAPRAVRAGLIELDADRLSGNETGEERSQLLSSRLRRVDADEVEGAEAR